MCPWLVQDLTVIGLWNDDIRATIIHNNGKHASCTMAAPCSLGTGSIQSIPQIPADIKAIYRTAWEIDPCSLIDMASDRAPFVDQSQSLSLWVSRPHTSLLVRRPRFCLRCVLIIVVGRPRYSVVLGNKDSRLGYTTYTPAPRLARFRTVFLPLRTSPPVALLRAFQYNNHLTVPPVLHERPYSA